MTDQRIALLEEEIERLKKINLVLMDRVERSMDLQGDSFSIFQTAVLLEDKVRERTRDLEAAQRMLHEAIGCIDEGFALYDCDDHLVLSNDRFRQMWGLAPDAAGSFESLLRGLVMAGRIPVPGDDRDGWIAARVAQHRSPGAAVVLCDNQGTWMQVSERRTRDGGTVCLYTDITNFKAQESAKRQEDLVKAVERLTVANTELERFAYVASHDLREPLRTIVSFTQLLQRNLADRPDLADYMDLIVGAGQRMHALIGGLLDYSRLSSQAAPFQACAMDKIAQVARENLMGSIHQVQAEIHFDGLPVVQADPVQMVQVLQNLMGNAIKYRSPERKPQVWVKGQAASESWIVSVADNGIGIEDSQQDIYELFRRLHPHHTYPGAGVGLAVCRRIVQHHGGRLWHEPNPDGAGTVFRFTLPRQQERAR